MIVNFGCTHMQQTFVGWESLIKSMLAWKQLYLACEQSFFGVPGVNARSVSGDSILETSLASPNIFSGLWGGLGIQ